jgi:AAT family amino acid transporter
MSHKTDGNPSVSDDSQGGSLRRGLKKNQVQMVALGGVIGSAYFLGTGYTLSATGPGAIFAFAFAGALVFMMMLCLGELSVAMPVAGSFIGYTSEFVSPAVACGIGWAYWACIVAYVPSECVAAGIIMNNFFPMIQPFYWAVLFGLLITIINIGKVEGLGRVESVLALTKIIAILGFSVLAVLIFLGIIGSEHSFIGTSYVMDRGGFFPVGAFALVLTMVMVLVNYGGTEIVGLTAAEAEDPATAIPAAVKNVSVRIVGLYVIPLFLLSLIFPWDQAGTEESVFAAALSYHGLNWAGGLFSVIVLIAAFSCANCNLYACIRALYSLSKEGMAPKTFGKLNKKSVPSNAALFSLILIWIVIGCYSFDASGFFYTYLLAISGFTGALCWLTICLAQVNFRKRFLARGYLLDELKFKVPGSPYTGYITVILFTLCLLINVLSPDLRPAFYIGAPAFLIPAILYKVFKVSDKRGEEINKLVDFNGMYPHRNQ